jgi:hypothetical protein
MESNRPTTDLTSVYNFYTHVTNLKIPENEYRVEYVWIDNTGITMRSKSKMIYNKKINSIADLDSWDFDGSSTG